MGILYHHYSSKNRNIVFIKKQTKKLNTKNIKKSFTINKKKKFYVLISGTFFDFQFTDRTTTIF